VVPFVLKTVTRTNEMIEDLIDFIEIHPIVAFEAIYEPMLTSFWSLISFAVQLYIIMQYKSCIPGFTCEYWASIDLQLQSNNQRLTCEYWVSITWIKKLGRTWME
jgi:hypothetical protein